MPDGLLQLASTIFLTFGLGTLLYAIVTYVLKHLVGEAPAEVVRPAQSMPYPAPAGPRYYAQPYAMAPPQQVRYQPPAQQPLPGYGPPPQGYPQQGHPQQQGSWGPPGAPPRG